VASSLAGEQLKGQSVSVLDRLCGVLVRRRWLWLLLAVLLTLLAWPISQQLTFDQTIESLYAADNPRLLAFRRSKAIFGGDEFLIVAYRDPDLFADDVRLTDAARERLDALVARLREIPGIEPDSIQDAATALRSPYGRSKIREFLTGVLVGEDGQTTAVMARLQPVSETSVDRGETFRQVRALADQHDPPAVVVGEPIQVHDMFRYVEADGFTLGLASSALLMLVILVLFRSVRWMLLPWLVVQVALVWTRALLVVSQLELSMVSSMMDSLVTIIGIATVMHVTIRYRSLRAHHPRGAAVLLTLRQLATPVFWAIATTAAGFAALMTSSIAPVASFGLMMTLATLLVLVAAALVLPGGILVGRQTTTPATAPAEGRLTAGLVDLTHWVEQRPWTVAGTMAVITLFCGYGLQFLRLETDFSKNFRATSPIVRALDFFETRLGGAGTWEVNFAAPDRLTDEFLEDVRALAADLRELEQRTGVDRLTKAIVLTDGLDLIPARVLFTSLSLETRIRFLDALQPEFSISLYNPEARRMRIMLRALERQPSETKLELIAEVERRARQRFPDAEATGLFVLLTYLIESLMADQLSSTLMAAVQIVIMMIIATRSLTLGVLLLIPNSFPIVLVLGSMGWLGLQVNIASAMIASVSMGLTIDSAIHYLYDYRAARQTGLNFADALNQTHQGVGLALVFANVALVIGFTVLTLSHFVPLIYFGVLVSVAMIGGLIGNMVLLPLMLRLTDGRSPRVEE
jgi:hypothetical protein